MLNKIMRIVHWQARAKLNALQKFKKSLITTVGKLKKKSTVGLDLVQVRKKVQENLMIIHSVKTIRW